MQEETTQKTIALVMRSSGARIYNISFDDRRVF